MKKRFLSTLLTLCMVLATLPVTPAMAAETTVSNETDLITAVANGGTVTLGGDITLTDTLNVTKDVTLDLNDKTLTGAGDTVIAVKSGGNLTINGSTTGSIIGSTGGDGGTAITVEGGSLTVSSGNVIGGKGGDIDGEYARGSNGGAAITVKGGSLTVSGGKVIGGKGGIGHNIVFSYGGNGGDGLYIAGGTVTISGGEITGGNGNIGRNDSYITGTVGGMGGNALYVAGGTVTIDGSGTIRGGDGGNSTPGQLPVDFGGDGGNGVFNNGGAVTIVSNGTISGGTAGTGGSGINGSDLSQSETGEIVTYSWYNADVSEFTISTVSELLGFANLVNGTDLPAGFPENVTFEDKTVKLGADIDLSSVANWTPIGGSNKFFKGTFDGNGKKISNLTVNSTGQYDYVGLFGRIADANVKNLAVSGDVIGTGNRSEVGGIVGELNGGSITNCSFSGSVTGDGNFVGGIVGCSYGTILKCGNTAEVSGSAYYIGGIVGIIGSADVLYCYNQGTVTSNGNNADVGGIAGNICADGNDATLTSCYSIGSVSATGTNACIGGTIGTISSDTGYTITVDDSYYPDSVAVNGIGLTNTVDDSTIIGEAVAKSSTAFSSGEVAWLLQNAVAEGDGQVWGQTLAGSNKDTYPVFANESGSNKVYKVTFKVDGKADQVEYVNSGAITVADPTAPNGYTFGG